MFYIRKNTKEPLREKNEKNKGKEKIMGSFEKEHIFCSNFLIHKSSTEFSAVVNRISQ
jgi:hypothetical protein